jgi:hypothetical protein
MRTVLFGLVACALGVAATGESPAAARISDMGWITGHWVDDSGGDLSEETWGPTSGDCVAGMWRWVVGGKAKLYELLTITAEEDGLVLRLRHFDRAGVGWEDKDHPLILRLARAKEREAAFEGPGTKGFLRLTYRRVDADTLTCLLEKGASEKEAQVQEFRYRRRPL